MIPRCLIAADACAGAGAAVVARSSCNAAHWTVQGTFHLTHQPVEKSKLQERLRESVAMHSCPGTPLRDVDSEMRVHRWLWQSQWGVTRRRRRHRRKSDPDPRERGGKSRTHLVHADAACPLALLWHEERPLHSFILVTPAPAKVPTQFLSGYASLVRAQTAALMTERGET